MVKIVDAARWSEFSIALTTAHSGTTECNIGLSGDQFDFVGEIAKIRAVLLRARKARPGCSLSYIDRGTEDVSAKMPDYCDCSKNSNRSPLKGPTRGPTLGIAQEGKNMRLTRLVRNLPGSF